MLLDSPVTTFSKKARFVTSLILFWILFTPIIRQCMYTVSFTGLAQFRPKCDLLSTILTIGLFLAATFSINSSGYVVFFVNSNRCGKLMRMFQACSPPCFSALRPEVDVRLNVSRLMLNGLGVSSSIYERVMRPCITCFMFFIATRHGAKSQSTAGNITFHETGFPL